MLFQSTPPHGERLTFGADTANYFTFQSTLPHEERQLSSLVSSMLTWFQSTLPRGERPTAPPRTNWMRRFNPRPPHGERLPNHNQLKTSRKGECLREPVGGCQKFSIRVGVVISKIPGRQGVAGNANLGAGSC